MRNASHKDGSKCEQHLLSLILSYLALCLKFLQVPYDATSLSHCF